MKRIKVNRLVVFLFIMVMMLSACGKKSYNSMETTSSSAGRNSQGTSTEVDTSKADSGDSFDGNSDVYNSGSTDSAEAPVANEDTVGVSSSTELSTGDVDPKDKIITTYFLDVETQDFDTLIKNINDKINSLGGYVESSSISGKSYYDDNVTRTGNIVARIPNEKVDEFVNNVDDTANVTNKESSTENVTLQYVDIQSRIEALETEQDRLFAILEKAVDLESIITLESRLSDIRYELQNYESQLRVYDNEVQYSTVTLNINEVERISTDTKKKPTFASRISNGFSDSMYHIGEGLKDFVVWFIVNLPYLLIWGTIIYIIVFITRKLIKRSNKKKVMMPPPNYNYPNPPMPPMQQYPRPQEPVNPNQSQNTDSQKKL